MIRQGHAKWLVCLGLVVLPGAGDVNRRPEAARATLRLDHFEVKLTRFNMGGRDPKANIQAVENSQAGPGTKDFAFDWSFSWNTGNFSFKGKLTVNTPLTIAVGDSAPISATGNGDWNNSGFGYDRDPGIRVWAGGAYNSKLVDKQVSNGSFGVHNVTATTTMRTTGITGDTSIDFGATSAFACNRGGCGDGTGCPFGVLCCCGHGVQIEVKAVYKHEEARPEITLDKPSLSYTARPGEAGPAPQSVAASNTGGGVLNWLASATYAAPAGADAWLAIKPASGTLASGESASFEVSVDPLRLAPGETHTATISVSGNASNSPQAVAVTAEYQRDLAVDRIEVVQVVQDADHTVPLMARKKTVARVFIKLTPASSQPVAGVTARLRGSRSDGEMPDSPLRPFNGPITAPVSPRRDSLDHSLNFELPAAWTEGGRLRLEAEVRPPAGFRDAWADDTLSRTVTFIEPVGWPRPFIVGYLPVCYQPPGQARPLCPSDANIAAADALLGKLYPMPAEDVLYLPLPPKVWRRALTSGTQDQLITALRKQYELMDSGAELMDQVAAWLPPIPNPANPADAPALGMSDPKWSGDGGLGRVTWQQDTTATDRLDPAFTLAHELAHNFGRRHTNLADGCNAIDPDTDWKLPDSTIQEVGFDPEARQVKPANLKDVMTYCSPPAANIWISAFTFRKLIDSRLAPQGAAAAAAKGKRTAEGPAEYAIVSGSARRDGSAGRLDPVYRVSASGPAPPPGVRGNHCLRFSKAEALLATYCFNLEFKDHRTRRLLEEESFTLKVPYPAGTTRVSLMREEQELASLSASSGAPTVSITAPQAGERWSGGQLTITWSASHPEGNPLTYAVLYSPDGGRAWAPLELDWPEPQYALDPAQITGGKQVFFRVLATDGLNTAQATVGPIEVVQTPRAELEPATIDFRKVLVGQSAERTLVLKNRGSGPLTVRGLDLDAGAFSVVAPKTPFTVVAGSQRTITVRFIPATAGALAARLTVNSDDPSPAGSPVLLAGSGVDRLVPQIEVAPGELDFGTVNVGEIKDL